ncbi:MAG: hypothetical protein IPN76_13170 [Saprospiraceae bacterium]|nr:hypothetical protein [Saprospiraceae bacterium]
MINVPAGIYAENLVIEKELTINGPNALIDPCSELPCWRGHLDHGRFGH